VRHDVNGMTPFMGGLCDEPIGYLIDAVANALGHHRWVDGNADDVDAGSAGARGHNDCAVDV
jgi:hypothetical protein